MSSIIVYNTGNKSGTARKTPVMRVPDGDSYVIVGSMGGAPKIPTGCTTFARTRTWRSAIATACRRCACTKWKTGRKAGARLWDLAVAAFPPYAEYQQRTSRRIPVFVAEPT